MRSITPSTNIHYRVATVCAGCLVLLFAWYVRIRPFFRSSGIWAFPIDYDEGVYFATAALFNKGFLPYRDFVSVHPPGLVLFLSGVAKIHEFFSANIQDSFVFAKGLATFVGVLNTALVGVVVKRVTKSGSIALLAASLYAIYPEAVTVERGTFLEPILNLTCLLVTFFVIERQYLSSKKILAAGIFCGLAMTIKLWAGIWFLAVLVTLPKENRFRYGFSFATAATITWLLCILPFFASAPRNFYEQILLFHLGRAPDGDIAKLPRLLAIWKWYRFPIVFLCFSWVMFSLNKSTRENCRRISFVITTYVLILCAFMASPSYWDQYNAFLAPSESILAAVALSTWCSLGYFQKFPNRLRVMVLVLLSLGLVIPGAYCSLRATRMHNNNFLNFVTMAQSVVGSDKSLCAFEPAWGLALGFLPQNKKSIVADPYATMLMDAKKSGIHFENSAQAFAHEMSATTIKNYLEVCDLVILGWRGQWQLPKDAKDWFYETFTNILLPVDYDGLDLWLHN